MVKKKNYSEEIGKIFFELRKSKGLSQTDLAKLSNTSQMTVQRAETGHTGLRMEAVISIAEALGIALTELFEEIEGEKVKAAKQSSKWSKIVTKVNELPLNDRNWISDVVETIISRFK